MADAFSAVSIVDTALRTCRLRKFNIEFELRASIQNPHSALVQVVVPYFPGTSVRIRITSLLHILIAIGQVCSAGKILYLKDCERLRKATYFGTPFFWTSHSTVLYGCMWRSSTRARVPRDYLDSIPVLKEEWLWCIGVMYLMMEYAHVMLGCKEIWNNRQQKCCNLSRVPQEIDLNAKCCAKVHERINASCMAECSLNCRQAKHYWSVFVAELQSSDDHCKLHHRQSKVILILESLQDPAPNGLCRLDALQLRRLACVATCYCYTGADRLDDWHRIHLRSAWSSSKCMVTNFTGVVARYSFWIS